MKFEIDFVIGYYHFNGVMAPDEIASLMCLLGKLRKEDGCDIKVTLVGVAQEESVIVDTDDF